MNFKERETLYAPILRQAFALEGLPPQWGPAFARRESTFRPDAEVDTGGDARRGGSFGLCMMSMKTATGELRYTGDATSLKNAQVNAALAARYCKILATRFKTTDIKEIASRYNSGGPYHLADAATLAYVADVVSFAKFYEVNHG